MAYKGSCHCGRVAFEVDGEPESVVDCISMDAPCDPATGSMRRRCSRDG